ncbi:PREDICTED: probable 28S ribosomal protein S6, mitochondrial [Ceratosolen solmsi marchali]|uniref:Small ribosomal subunit protein bS6m n=1 Tax=Ceratosolen solmsi marchali TaxID=326594 RepID=A0AAJ6YI44_9HYME|nr:PREDICTED: probable 28S ribosomal protein S6, mitochondrial [Ceratosolen solmsi marchali]
MPVYEMPIIIKLLSKKDLFTILKRTANSIFDKGGLIRKIDNLGKLALPYKMKELKKEANFFIFHFDMPPAIILTLNKDLKRDVDILKWQVYNTNEKEKIECTLDNELLPPPYRRDVQELIELGNKHRRKSDRFKFKFNTGLNYYPFQR